MMINRAGQTPAERPPDPAVELPAGLLTWADVTRALLDNGMLSGIAERPGLDKVRANCRVMCWWHPAGLYVKAVHPACPMHGYDGLIAAQREVEGLHAHGDSCPHSTLGGLVPGHPPRAELLDGVYVTWECGGDGGEWLWMTSLHPFYRPQPGPNVDGLHSPYRPPGGAEERCATDGEVWPCRPHIALTGPDQADQETGDEQVDPRLAPVGVVMGRAEQLAPLRQRAALAAAGGAIVFYEPEEIREGGDRPAPQLAGLLADRPAEQQLAGGTITVPARMAPTGGALLRVHDRYAATLTAAGATVPPPMMLGDRRVDAAVRVTFALGEVPDAWLVVAYDFEADDDHAYTVVSVVWRPGVGYQHRDEGAPATQMAAAVKMVRLAGERWADLRTGEGRA